MKIKFTSGSTTYELQIKSKVEDALRKQERQLKGVLSQLENIASGGAPGMAAEKIRNHLRGKIPKKQLKVFDDLIGIQKGANKAAENTLNDTKRRAAGWVAQVVTGVYNIKKSDIVPSSSKSGNRKKMAGSIRIEGETVGNMTLQYSGRMLTPVRFGMTPKSPPQGRRYTLKMQVIKGKTSIIGRYLPTRTPGGPYSKRSHNILMGTGNTREGGTNFIPFQRVSENRTDLQKFTTISVPQMIASERVAPELQEKLSTEIGKRFDHNMKRQLGIK